eukprot:Nk52_evm16s1485 gene=Nk52_evmTU16s1485
MKARDNNFAYYHKLPPHPHTSPTRTHQKHSRYIFLPTLLLLLTASPSPALAQEIVYFGSVLPTSVFPAMLAAVHAGYEDFGKNVAGGVTLKWEPFADYNLDDEATPLLGLSHTAALQSRGVAIIIGAVHSAISAQIGVLNAANGVLQFSPLSSSPVLSEKKDYPTFARFPANDYSQALATAELIKELGFKRLHIITTDDVSASGITGIASEDFTRNNITVASVERIPFGIDRLKKRDVVQARLRTIRSLGGRVIYMSANIKDAQAVIEEAEKLDMIGNKQHMWFGSGAWTYPNLITDGNWTGHEQSLVGIMGTTTRYDYTKPKFAQFLRQFEASWPQVLNIPYSPLDADAVVTGYDTVRVLVYALNNTITRLQAMGIAPSCLNSHKFASDPNCLISEVERQAIYDRSIANKYNGVKEYMQLLRKNDTVTFGPKSRYVPTVLLEEIYKTKLACTSGDFELDENGDGGNYYNLSNYQAVQQADGSFTYEFKLIGFKHPGLYNGITYTNDLLVYPGGTNENPNRIRPSDGEDDAATSSDDTDFLYVYVGSAIALVLLVLLVWWQIRRAQRKYRQSQMEWLINDDEVIIDSTRKISGLKIAKSIDDASDVLSQNPSSVGSANSQMSVAKVKQRDSFFVNEAYSTGTWRQKKVILKKAKVESFNPKDAKICQLLYDLTQCRHPNVLGFYGIIHTHPFVIQVEEHCKKGCLEDILIGSDIEMSSLLIFSILTDIAKGLKFLHNSDFEAHGHISPKSSFIDNNWTCKVGHFGLVEVFRNSTSVSSEEDIEKALLWTPPELIALQRVYYHESSQEKLSKLNRIGPPKVHTAYNAVTNSLYHAGSRASLAIKNTFNRVIKPSIVSISQPIPTNPCEEVSIFPMSPKGDIWSFAIIINQMMARDEPFGHCQLEVNEIIEKVEAKDPEILDQDETDLRFKNEALMSLAKTCLAFDPENRPSITTVLNTLNKANPHRGASVADNMAQLLQSYADNLEDIVAQRTKQLSEKSAALEVQTEKIEHLLYELLPKTVANRLLNGEAIQPENYDCVSVFFSDIVGYTKICSLSNPLEVISFLNELYTKFDHTLESFDVYKVETIGDAYFVVSGVPERNGNKHVRELSLMALNLLADMSGIKLAHMDNMQLQLRIGIHSGPCVAGVVGVKMPHFTLYGDTINTASRMESGGLALRIHISGDTAALLQKHFPTFELEERGTVEVKGKGAMTTYWLNGEKHFNRELPNLALQASASQHSFK